MSRGTTKKKNFTMTVISNRKRFWVVKINAKLFTAPKSLEIKKCYFLIPCTVISVPR